jgi:alkylhydroperoxidase family enzyme
VILIKEGMPGEEQQRFVDGLRATPIMSALSPKERALLDYADVLTLTPAAVTRAHVDRLRAEGYDDRAIHDACCIVGYFALVNRVADGLGVELEGQG